MKAARAVKEDEMAKEIGALLAVVITDKARYTYSGIYL